MNLQGIAGGALDTDTSPLDREWRVVWTGPRPLDPSGVPRDPIWDNTDDALAIRIALDRWARSYDLARLLPSTGPWSSWWPVRFHVGGHVLPRILPNLRLLKQIRRELGGNPRRITAENPPDAWWKDLLRCVFPTAEVVATGRRSRMRRLADLEVGLRAVRAVEGGRRLLELRPKRRPRALVLSRERSWDGERDREMGPIADALRESGVEVVIMTQSRAYQGRRFRGLRTRPRDHLFDDTLNLVCLLTRGVPRQSLPNLPRTGLEFEGVDLAEVVAPSVATKFQRSNLLTRLHAEGLARVLPRIDPDVAILPDEYGSNQGMMFGLQQAGVPVVATQHGVIYENHLAYVYPDDADKKTIPRPDLMCVYGRHERDILVRGGAFEAGRVAVTGQAQSDQRVVRTSGARQRSESIRRKMLAGGFRRLLLFTSQAQYRSVTEPILMPRFARSSPDNMLVLRPHPGEDADGFWQQSIERHGVRGRVHVDDSGAIDEWLDACDVHLSGFSTVLSEATVMGKPNIVVGVDRLGDPTGCVAENVAIRLEDFASLDAALEECLTEDPARRAEAAARRAAYVERHFHVLDGNAGARIADAAKSLMGRCRT